ncbi:hypothetical protein Scep_021576 [Stephania cephalantha]|uniref:Uncharacterized protein n=1 Tax=Stephania cephalantha TaxID=152367 RepID=A0AAP0F978_9MAGN
MGDVAQLPSLRYRGADRDSDGVAESSNEKQFLLKLDAREATWVQRAISEAIGKQQWIWQNFRGDEGILILKTLESHAGKLMRIWRVCEMGWDIILVPGGDSKGEKRNPVRQESGDRDERHFLSHKRDEGVKGSTSVHYATNKEESWRSSRGSDMAPTTRE